jgi:chemotaxis protein MotC
LVKGSLLAVEKPAEALALLDQARLLSPGTLVEEAALRRSVALDATQGDAARVALASTQYVERYRYSPYSSQFADAFVSGVIALHEAISQDKLIDITSMMDAEREKVIYLRIARRAAIDGFNDLSTFASEKAEEGRNGKNNDDDPRALLYASLSTVTSATVEDVRAKLKTIDRSRLSEGDQSLLDAARAVVSEMVAVPAPPAQKPAAMPLETPDAAPAVPAPVEQASAQTDLPPVEGVLQEKPAAAAPVSPPSAPVSSPDQATAPTAPAPAKTPEAAPDATDAAIADARRKLESIDQILGVSPK